MYDVKRAYSLLERISFERMGGTENELKAANILKEEIEKYQNGPLQILQSVHLLHIFQFLLLIY